MALLESIPENLMRQYREAAMRYQRRIMSDPMVGLGNALGSYGSMGLPSRAAETFRWPDKPKSYREELQAEIDEWLK